MLYSRKEAILETVRRVQIHGIDFYDIIYLYQEELDARPQLARVPGEMIYSGVQTGDRVMIERIANTVMRVEKL